MDKVNFLFGSKYYFTCVKIKWMQRNIDKNRERDTTSGMEYFVNPKDFNVHTMPLDIIRTVFFKACRLLQNHILMTSLS